MNSTMFNRFVLLIAAFAILGTGCRKIKQSSNSTTVTVTPEDKEVVPEAGKGGNATLQIVPVHDGLDIDSCMVYIKYNTGVVPGQDNYDDSAKAYKNEDGVPVATFRDLKTGNYYLFGRGWDLIRSQKVRGGLFFVVEEEKKATVHTFDVQLQEYE